MPHRKQPSDKPPRAQFHRPDGHFPSHSVQVTAPGIPYTNYYTTVGHFDTDQEAIDGAFADHPLLEVRVTRHDGVVIYDSKMKGKQ